MTVIYATVTDAAAQPLRNETVHFSLVSASMWNATGKFRVSRIASRITNTSGYVEVDLPPQSTYADTGTFYRFEHGTQVDYFTVPDTGGPYSLFNRLRDPTPESTKFKVTPKIAELADAAATVASAGDGQTLGYDATAKTWGPVTRVTAQQLADGLAPKATTAAMNTADGLLAGRATALETRASSTEAGLATKASSVLVSSIDTRVQDNTAKVGDLLTRVGAIEGGGTGGGAAPIHSGLRGLVTNPNTGAAVDDHPQYLNQERGDLRYYTRQEAQSAFAGIKHAGRHKASGNDPLTPGDIGAAIAGHTLLEHSVDSAAQVRPLVRQSRDLPAGAASGMGPHATLIADVSDSSGTGSTQRSLREPIEHIISALRGNIVIGAQNGNELFRYEFIMRESADLFLTLSAACYCSHGGTMNIGAVAQGIISFYLYDLDNNTERVWDGYQVTEFNAYVGANNYRPMIMNTMNIRIPGGPFIPGHRYRFAMNGQKHPTGWADIALISVNGSLRETVAVVG